jgi:hypothetical protein
MRTYDPDGRAAHSVRTSEGLYRPPTSPSCAVGGGELQKVRYPHGQLVTPQASDNHALPRSFSPRPVRHNRTRTSATLASRPSRRPWASQLHQPNLSLSDHWLQVGSQPYDPGPLSSSPLGIGLVVPGRADRSRPVAEDRSAEGVRDRSLLVRARRADDGQQRAGAVTERSWVPQVAGPIAS